MPEYNIVVRATITKSIIVKADNEADAIEAAHARFTTEYDGDERYNQETVSCREAS